jgi:truncated hemoglobin YjbI
LRDLPLTNEERRRAIEFILETQAQLTVNHEKHDKRLDRLERIARLMVRPDCGKDTLVVQLMSA